MANMSYCRFENTLNDLRDCYRAVRTGEADCDEDLSERERDAKAQLLALCKEFVAECEGSDAPLVCENSMVGRKYPYEYRGHFVHGNDDAARFEVHETKLPAEGCVKPLFASSSRVECERAIDEVVDEMDDDAHRGDIDD